MKKKEFVWEQVWCKDNYSDPEIRREKAKKKVDILLNLLPIELNEKNIVLDAGCGGGYLSEYLAQKTGAHIIAFDRSPTAVNLCKEKQPLGVIQCVCCDASHIPYETGKADVVMCVGLIEHIKKTESCIQEILRIRKPGGYVFIISSNKFSIMFLQWLLLKLLRQWKYGYQKNWSPLGLKRHLEKFEIRTISMEVIGGIGNYKKIDRIDTFFRKYFKFIGRYIVYFGEKKC